MLRAFCVLAVVFGALTIAAAAPPPTATELEAAVAAHDSDRIVLAMRELAITNPALAIVAIPDAYANIEQAGWEEFFQGDRYRIFKAAVAALLSIQDEKLLFEMVKNYKKLKAWQSRVLVLQVTWQKPKLDALGLALEALKDKSPQVVALAARILGNSKLLAPIEPLIRAMAAWEKREVREKVAVGREQVQAEIGGQAWVACRDALHRLTGQSFFDSLDYKNYFDAHRAKIDPAKIDIDNAAEHEGTTGVGLFGLDITGRNIVFILDISGSMETSDPLTPEQEEELRRPRTGVGGVDEREKEMLAERKRILRAKKNLSKVVQGLAEDRNFNIIAYGTDMFTWRDLLVSATSESRDKALEFITNLKADGVTFTDVALQRALEDPSVDTIYLITDGAPTHVGISGPGLPSDARELMAEILENMRQSNYLRNIRLFTLGFEGAEEDFLRQLARENHGKYVRIK
ncbi:MAG: VWA domain-containing protein [Planctomycetota bacterium]